MIRKEYEAHVARMLDELAERMRAAGETPQAAGSKDAESSDKPAWSMPVVVTYEPGAARAWVVPAAQDWVHDALYDAVIIGGTLYAADEPFLPGRDRLSGYFQASDTGLWLKVEGGSCDFAGQAGELAWKRELADFPELAAQSASIDERAWALYAEQIRSELDERPEQ